MDHEASARCPNGYHKDERGECEKVVNNKVGPGVLMANIEVQMGIAKVLETRL